MSIDVLAADERGDENVQRWLASGLPVPPSWRISRQAVLEQDTDGLVRRLRALPRMFNGERYWVLHQGAMNAESQRESLLNLDSDEALAAALTTVFGRDPAPEQVVVQALPRQRAAGVLFTRHPLRQDLPHMVVEGVAEGGAERQRLIFDEDGRLVYRADSDAVALDQAVPASQLLALGEQLKRGFERPQAGEWIHDGERLWLLQTLPVGSLPVPKEVWTRRATPALFNQALTPLWYTLAGRWLKTHFWRRLVEKHGFELLEVLAKLTINPARLLGLEAERGGLSPGKLADVAVFDIQTDRVIDPEGFESKGRNSCFGGLTMRGSTIHTFVAGRQVVSEGRVLGPSEETVAEH